MRSFSAFGAVACFVVCVSSVRAQLPAGLIAGTAMDPDGRLVTTAQMTTCDLQSVALDAAQNALLRFVDKVTDAAQTVVPSDIQALRDVGWSELQIAEAVHLTALFACFNRIVSSFGLPSQHVLRLQGRTR